MVPISVAILLGLFMVQRLGTSVVGRFFGPIIVLWFATLAVSGLGRIVLARHPRRAQPAPCLGLPDPSRLDLFAAVGACLALTGAEALYADMGHFGRKPIQIAWPGWCCPRWR